MKRRIIPAVVISCILLAMLFFSRRHEETAPPATAPTTPARIEPPALKPPVTPITTLPVASTAAALNDPAGDAQDDIRTLQSLLDEYRRHLGGNPVGDNAEIAAALLGANPKRLACLPAAGSFLDATGRLIDRWGTPYFFHALSGEQMEILSAGPDRQFHSADDLHGEY